MNRLRIERLATTLEAAFPVCDLDAMPLGPLPAAWKCDLSDNSLDWAPGVYDIFGLSRGAPVSRPDVLRLYCDDSLEELEKLRTESIAQRRSFTFEARIRRLDGARRWMRVTADVVCSNGRATHLYGMKQDITAEMMLSGHAI